MYRTIKELYTCTRSLNLALLNAYSPYVNGHAWCSHLLFPHTWTGSSRLMEISEQHKKLMQTTNEKIIEFKVFSLKPFKVVKLYINPFYFELTKNRTFFVHSVCELRLFETFPIRFQDSVSFHITPNKVIDPIWKLSLSTGRNAKPNRVSNIMYKLA